MKPTPPFAVYPAWLQSVSRHSSLLIPAGMLALIGVILVPLPPALLDLLLTASLALSVVILLTAFYAASPLDFSVFPSLLLGTTVLRLVLNVASTRLILTADAAGPEEVAGVAGRVIQAFGDSVAGGSVAVGFIIFLILVVVQFVVITKGATRISEVGARFALDGMPGKQMAVDADLGAGLIDQAEAHRRREEIARQADFYGAMDGASKFVRGDAVAGLVITVINIVGGFAVGVFEKGWPVTDTLRSFTKLTIGDGLVAQVPAFIIAVAAGLIVTRAGDPRDLGGQIAGQLGGRPAALGIAAVFILALALAGMPAIPAIMIAAVLGTLAYGVQSAKPQAIAVPPAASGLAPLPLLPTSLDTLELEVGYGLIRLVDAKLGGDMLQRIAAVRHGVAGELGIRVPPVRIHDDLELPPHDYRVKLRGNPVGRGTVHPGRWLAVDTGRVAPGSEALQGTRTREPAMGLPAVWIDATGKPQAHTAGYTLVDAAGVIATHLTELVKKHSGELLTREETAHLVAQLQETSPRLVEEVIGPQLKIGELQAVLQNLLRERVSIGDLEMIVESLGGQPAGNRGTAAMTEIARRALRRTLCAQYAQADQADGHAWLFCVTLAPSLECVIEDGLAEAEGSVAALPGETADRATAALLGELQHLILEGRHPVVLTPPRVRASIRRLLETRLPTAAVLSYHEICPEIQVKSVGAAQIEMEETQAGPQALRRPGFFDRDTRDFADSVPASPDFSR